MKNEKYHIVFFMITILVLISAFSLAACGGGGDGGGGSASTPPSVQEGVFLDSAVEGIEYQTSTQSGLTDANGTFKYQEGETITFSIGDIDLGQTSAMEKITPVDIVPGATDETHSKVTNMSRLLQSLDIDGNLNNGIKLTQDIRDEIKGRSIDFSMDTADFENSPDVQGLFDTLNQMGNVFTDSGTRSLCSAEQAQNHLRATLLECLAGEYSGTYSGDDYGTWSITADSEGNISGTARSTIYQETYSVFGTTASSGSMTLVIGGVSTGATFQGNIDFSGNVQGTWVNSYSGESGTFSGSRDS